MAGDSKRKRKGCDTTTANKNTSNLPFENTSTVDNVTNDQITIIYVKTFSDKIISLEVKSSDTIRYVKIKIWAEEDIPIEQQALIFNKMVLDDTNTIADFDIENYSTLKLMRQSSGLMPIFVKIPKMMTTSSLEAKPSETIGDVKAKIWDKEGIPIEEQVLIFNETVLEDSGTLVDFDIKKESTLKLMFKSRGSMKIFIKNVTSGTESIISLMVKPTDTTSKVKDEIESQVSIPGEKQVLIFNQMVLEDTSTLADFGIKMKSTLTLMRKSSGSFQIVIQRQDGSTIIANVKPLLTVDKLKAKIGEKQGIPSCNQTFLFNGNTLRDFCTLADYDIREGSILDHTFTQTGS